MALPVNQSTLKEVAKLAGTSVSTASVVLNKQSQKYVSEELRERVLEAANQLNYRPNLAARRIKGINGRSLAILVPQFENEYFNRIVIGAEEVATSRNYTLSIYSTQDIEERETGFIENLISLQIDGILISPVQNSSKSVELIQKVGIPYVVIDRCVKDDPADFVSCDHYRAAYLGTEHLIVHGHRKIAFFTWKSTLDAIRDRLKGFYDAAAHYELSPADYRVYEIDLDRNLAFELTIQALQEALFTGIFAAHHHLGEGIVDALRQINKQVPEDLSVVILGNPKWVSMSTPRFTSIVQPDIQMGQKAAELIINQIESGEHRCGRYILPVQLQARESVRDLRSTE